jgi:hypothetical protein
MVSIDEGRREQETLQLDVALLSLLSLPRDDIETVDQFVMSARGI